MTDNSAVTMLSNLNTLNLSSFLTFTPPSTTSTPSIDLNSPLAISDNAFSTNSFANSMRYLNNILLILFSHHPNAVSQSELALLYRQTFGETVTINPDLQYLLQTHPAIITHVLPYGILYTLNTHHMTHTLKSFDIFTLKPYLAQHVLRAFTVYPNGIPCAYFEDIVQRISQFRLSDLVPSWMNFVASIPYVTCSNINGNHVFINTFNLSLSELLLSPNISPCVDTSSAAAHVKHTEVKDDKSPFFEDHCSVFMGGFARNVETQDIRRELHAMGVIVISCTEIKRRKYGYSWVTLSSVKDADRLLGMSPIPMLGTYIDVRPFINRNKQRQEKPDHKVILETVVELLRKGGRTGLSVREIQPALYRTLSYRISGTDLVDIIRKNTHILHIQKTEGDEEKIMLN
eukprot:205950_1